MKKIISVGIVIFALAAIINQNANDKMINASLENINTLAMADDEGGSSTQGWTCYATYDNCSFWCDTIYRCGNPCTSVECDDQSDQGTCLM